MRRRYELDPRLWEWIKLLLPHRTYHGGRGHPWNDHYNLISSILWVLNCGAPWRDVPERYGPWQTVCDRFNRWRNDGTWSRILTRQLDHLDHRGRIGHELWCVDASVIRATRAAAGTNEKTRSAHACWPDPRRRNSKSRLTMRWATRKVASAPRSSWSAIVTASSWASMSPLPAARVQGLRDRSRACAAATPPRSTVLAGADGWR
jgi:transposase